MDPVGYQQDASECSKSRKGLLEELARKAKEAEEKRKKDAQAAAEAATVVLEAGSSFVDVMGTLKLNERSMLDHANPRPFPTSRCRWKQGRRREGGKR